MSQTHDARSVFVSFLSFSKCSEKLEIIYTNTEQPSLITSSQCAIYFAPLFKHDLSAPLYRKLIQIMLELLCYRKVDCYTCTCRTNFDKNCIKNYPLHCPGKSQFVRSAFCSSFKCVHGGSWQHLSNVQRASYCRCISELCSICYND